MNIQTHRHTTNYTDISFQVKYNFIKNNDMKIEAAYRHNASSRKKWRFTLNSVCPHAEPSTCLEETSC